MKGKTVREIIEEAVKTYGMTTVSEIVIYLATLYTEDGGTYDAGIVLNAICEAWFNGIIER